MSFSTLPSPEGLKYQQWTSIAAEQLAAEGVADPGAEDDWREWAADLPDGASAAIDPYGFNTWQDWAYAVIGTLP